MDPTKNLKLNITPATKKDLLELKALFTINLLTLSPYMPSTVLIARHEGK